MGKKPSELPYNRVASSGALSGSPETDAGRAALLNTERASATREADEVWISWYEWMARELNLLFLDRGLTGRPGRITAETVRDSLSMQLRMKQDEANEQTKQSDTTSEA